MESKLRTREEIISLFHDGQTIAIGGMGNLGCPHRLIDCLVESGAKDLTLIFNNVSDSVDGLSRPIYSGQAKKIITCHVGMCHEVSRLVNLGRLEVEFSPQGTLIERARCGGMGLGGVLVKTGIHTLAAEGKQTVAINGERWLVEPALQADISLTYARRADPLGNLAYHGADRNTNPIFVTCGKCSVVEVDFLLDVNELPPDDIVTPAPFVDMLLA